jgi:hypothetical protein
MKTLKNTDRPADQKSSPESKNDGVKAVAEVGESKIPGMNTIKQYIKGDAGLQRLLRQVARDIPFTESEFLCFCDVENDSVFLDPRQLEVAFGANVADSCPIVGDKWNVNLEALSKKLDALTLLEKCALLAAKDGFFAQNWMRRHGDHGMRPKFGAGSSR